MKRTKSSLCLSAAMWIMMFLLVAPKLLDGTLMTEPFGWIWLLTLAYLAGALFLLTQAIAAVVNLALYVKGHDAP